MNKLYFVETNGGYMTVATSDDGRACYMWQDGQEENYPNRAPAWDDAEPAEREQIARAWLEPIKECTNFESLYTDCAVPSGYNGVYTAEEFAEDQENGDSIIAEIDF